MLRQLALILGALCVLGILTGSAALLTERPGGGPLAGVYNVTPQRIAAPSDGQWCVAVLADVQGGFAYLPEVLGRVADFHPQAVLILGDVATQGDAVHMSLPVNELSCSRAPAPLFVVPGNHDVDYETGRTAFLRSFGGTTFDVTVGTTRFLGLDNAEGRLPPEQLAAVEGQLVDSAARGEHVVLCLHRPLIGLPDGDRPAETWSRELRALVQRHGVALVLSGHHHLLHDEVRDETRYVVVPATGDRSEGAALLPPAFTLLHDGPQIRTEIVWLPRRNVTDLRGTLRHFLLAHVRTWLPASASALGTLFVLCAATGVAGWWWWARGARQPA